MFYLDGILLNKYINEIKDQIINKKIRKIICRDKIFEFALNDKIHLTFRLDQFLPFFYLKNKSNEPKTNDTNFFLYLKKYFLNGIIKNINQIKKDRIVEIEISNLNYLGEAKKHFLIFELIPKYVNLIILNENKSIVTAFKLISFSHKNRVILPNIEYAAPIFNEKKDPFEIVEKEFKQIIVAKDELIKKVDGIGKMALNYIGTDFNKFKNYLNSNIQYIMNDNLITFFDFYSNSKTIEFENADDLFSNFHETQNLDAAKSILYLSIKKQKKHLNSIIKKIDRDIINATNFQKYKNIADILSANIYKLRQFKKVEKLDDFYENKEIIIDLDIQKSIQQNIENYYKLYNKKKRAVSILKKRKNEIINDLKYIESVTYFIDTALTIENIEQLKTELIELKYLKIKKVASQCIKKNILKNPNYTKLIINNHTVYVGKNNISNEYVTFKKAQSNDYWFHVGEYPGAHVILKLNSKNEEIDFETIKEVAKLAAHNSKLRNEKKVSVIYCLKKYVKKIPGAKPGLVRYDNNKTILT